MPQTEKISTSSSFVDGDADVRGPVVDDLLLVVEIGVFGGRVFVVEVKTPPTSP